MTTPSASERYQRLLRMLREARVEAGLTQTQAAAALGKPQSYVSKCESGERRIDAIELEEFARVYGKPITRFYAERPSAVDSATRVRRRTRG